jgi:hypothetical protein
MLGTVAGAGGAPRLPRLGTVVGAGADPALPRLGAIAGCAGAPRLPRLGTVSGCGGAPRLPRLGTVTGGGGHTLEGEAAWARRSAADVRQANTIRMSSSNVDATARSRPRLIRAPDTHTDFHAQTRCARCGPRSSAVRGRATNQGAFAPCASAASRARGSSGTLSMPRRVSSRLGDGHPRSPHLARQPCRIAARASQPGAQAKRGAQTTDETGQSE